jgi:hypothetical protein
MLFLCVKRRVFARLIAKAGKQKILPSLYVLCFLHKKKTGVMLNPHPARDAYRKFFFRFTPGPPCGAVGIKPKSNLLLAYRYFRFSYLLLCPFKPLSVILAATEPFNRQ